MCWYVSHISLYIKHDSPQESELITSFYSQIGKDSSLDVKCASFGSSLSRIRFDIDLDGIGETQIHSIDNFFSNGSVFLSFRCQYKAAVTNSNQ